jgi:hypothetical protein
MLGMEMMIANMIGMKPEELKQQVNGVINAIHAGVNNVKEINERLKRIEQHLEIGEFQNGRGKSLTGPNCGEHSQH